MHPSTHIKQEKIRRFTFDLHDIKRGEKHAAHWPDRWSADMHVLASPAYQTCHAPHGVAHEDIQQHSEIQNPAMMHASWYWPFFAKKTIAAGSRIIICNCIMSAYFFCVRPGHDERRSPSGIMHETTASDHETRIQMHSWLPSTLYNAESDKETCLAWHFRWNPPSSAMSMAAMSEIWNKSAVLTSSVMVNVCLGKHSVVLDLRLAKGRAVAADDHELALSTAQCLESALVSKSVLARLHNQSKTWVDGLSILLNSLCLSGCHLVSPPAVAFSGEQRNRLVQVGRPHTHLFLLGKPQPQTCGHSFFTHQNNSWWARPWARPSRGQILECVACFTVPLTYVEKIQFVCIIFLLLHFHHILIAGKSTLRLIVVHPSAQARKRTITLCLSSLQDCQSWQA